MTKNIKEITSKETIENSNNSELIIFYSWQSDLPNKTNRGLIEDALEIAVKKIRNDDSIKIIPRIDKDTTGIPGSPNIATTILQKIDASFLIVSDVSIVNAGSKDRPMPNPNVIYELGYAVKSLGIENIVMVQNTVFGDPDELPFDLKMHRTLPYACGQNGNVSESRKELASKLEVAIRLIMENKNMELDTPTVSVVDEFHNLLSTNASVMMIETKLKTIVDQFLSSIKQTSLYNYLDSISAEEFMLRKKRVEELLQDLVSIYFDFGKWANESQTAVIIRQFERIARPPYPDGGFRETWNKLAHYPGLLLLYALGLGAVYNGNAPILKAIFDVKIYNRVTGEDEPIYITTNAFNVIGEIKNLTKDNRFTPESDELYNFFKQYFGDVSEEKYEDIFDGFEYLITLQFEQYNLTKNEVGFWVPAGSYTWRTRRRQIWKVMSEEFKKTGENWIFFSSFRSDKSSLEKLFDTTNDYLTKNRSNYLRS